MPIENAHLIILFSADQECAFLRTCDDWQFLQLLLEDGRGRRRLLGLERPLPLAEQPRQ